jgi:hypothetical protein
MYELDMDELVSGKGWPSPHGLSSHTPRIVSLRHLGHELVGSGHASVTLLHHGREERDFGSRTARDEMLERPVLEPDGLRIEAV